VLPACGGAGSGARDASTLAQLRDSAGKAQNTEAVGRLLLAEMLEPGGTYEASKSARGRLGKPQGAYGWLARALFDELHGAPRPAAEGYIETLRAAATAEEPGDVPLMAWFAAHRLLGLRSSVPDLFEKNKAVITGLVNKPGPLGFRAVAELSEWAAQETLDRAQVADKKLEESVVADLGCATNMRIAGPFGYGVARDRVESFAAERAPWPTAWPDDPRRGSTPRVLKTDRHRCLITATEKTEDGIFYAETFLRVQHARDVLLAAQGALRVWVDGVLIVDRDPRVWGSWQRFGGVAHLEPGRHRVVIKLAQDATSLRVLTPQGTAAKIPTENDDGGSFGLVPATRGADPNPLDAALGHKDPMSPVRRALAAHAARVDSMNDVASYLMEPLVDPKDAAPVALALAADSASQDPIYPDDVRRKVERDLRERAATADPGLWYSRAWLVLDQVEQKGVVDLVEPLRKLAAEFPDEPDIREQVGRVYAKLGWRAERMRVLEDMATRFPDDASALRSYVAALEEDGSLVDADRVAAKLRKLDPDAEVDLDRALARQDWKAALAELQRIQARRPERKETAGRIANVLLKSGDPSAAFAQLSKALDKNPLDAAARFRLADMAFARGQGDALHNALADTIRAGGKGRELREALELIEGASFLEPYRVDPRKVIAEYEAWEKSGHKMAGVAARVLDYAATWVHPDGSSEMLEHEILKMQSQEAVGKEAEQKPPEGMVLRLRVLKPDGRVFEPQAIAGKPTLTMPHLEVGDYLEIEHITAMGGEAKRGRSYRGPHWFFREPDKGYWRSEFVVITPKDRPVEVESRGEVGAPKIIERGLFVERRFRVDESPPATQEPEGPPATEVLPSVRVAWGMSLADTTARLADLTYDESPLDPRLTRRAMEILGKSKITSKEERAQLAYKFVTQQIEDGQETDGRRVITGKSGSRQAAFYQLMRHMGIAQAFGLVKNRLATAAVGNASEIESWDAVALRIQTEAGDKWLTVRDKFAPFGYIPAEMRGQPVIMLVPGNPRGTVPAGGSVDGVRIDGRVDVQADGSAHAELTHTYMGKLAIGLRNVFDKIPEGQRKEFAETRLLGRNLPGARLKNMTVEQQADPSKPLVVRFVVDMADLVRMSAGRGTLKSLYPVHLSQLATLPERQTALILGAASYLDVHVQVVFPQDFRMPASLPTADMRDGERSVRVADAVNGHAIDLSRTVDLPAGRVNAGADYAAFVAFVQKSDQLTDREIVVGK
jgi:cellulose synthase operon protein C